MYMLHRRRSAEALSALALLASGFSVQATEHQEVKITPRLSVPAKAPLAGELVARRIDGEPLEVRFPLHGTDPVHGILPAAGRWDLGGTVPGFWVRRQEVISSSSTGPLAVTVELWALGRVSGKVTLSEPKAKAPAVVEVKSVAAPAALKRPQAPPGVLSCPLDEQGRFTCELPAARFDLAVTTGDFMPVYRWGIDVRPGMTADLGDVQLEKGASLTAWVTTEGGPIDPTTARARLAPIAACNSDLKAAIELDRMAIEAPVSADGVLNLRGLPPGTFTLEVKQPGFAPVGLPRVLIEPKTETFVPDPLVLRRPLEVTFEISPARDASGTPWRVGLYRRTSNPVTNGSVVFEGHADLEGRFTLEDLAAEPVQLRIEDATGNRMHSSGTLFFEGPGPHMHRIELSQVYVKGTLVVGDEPVPGTLWFGGRFGGERMEFHADSSGQFQGALTRAGSWVVDVDSLGGTVRRRVLVEAGASGTARVTISLPNTRIFGRVLDETGKPASQAEILLRDALFPQLFQAKQDGSFDLRGLAVGDVELVASLDPRLSERTKVHLEEGSEVGPLILRLRGTMQLQGRVRTTSGPVAGARVRLYALAPQAGGGEATTSADGRFSLALPTGITTASAIVQAPGYGFRAFPSLPVEASLDFLLAVESGELEIQLPISQQDIVERELGLLVVQDGTPIDGTILLQWAAQQGVFLQADASVIKTPHLAPGTYSACFLPRAEVDLVSTGAAAARLESCASGELAAGAVLTLAPKLPRSPSPPVPPG